jgi:hypothetical protein
LPFFPIIQPKGLPELNALRLPVGWARLGVYMTSCGTKTGCGRSDMVRTAYTSLNVHGGFEGRSGRLVVEVQEWLTEPNIC